MLPSKEVLKCGMALGLIFNLVFTTVSPVKEIATYVRFAWHFKISGKIATSAHTTSKNVDPAIAEKEYLRVRSLLGLGKINDKVVIILATPDERGIIGVMDKDEVYGVYNNNIIVYNGEQATLQHELAHFFFDKVHEYQRSELFAQSVEGIFYLLGARR